MKKPLKKFQKPPADTPVLPSVRSKMELEILVNDQGKALFLHSKPLQEAIWWAEYDVDLKELYFVTVKAKIQGSGFKIFDELHEYLQTVDELMIIREKDLGMPQIVKLIVRKNTLSDI